MLLALWLSLGFLFLAASARKALLLRSIVRAGFQFVGFAGEAVEVKDFLGVLAHGDDSFCPISMWIASGVAVPRLAWIPTVVTPSQASASCNDRMTGLHCCHFSSATSMRIPFISKTHPMDGLFGSGNSIGEVVAHFTRTHPAASRALAMFSMKASGSGAGITAKEYGVSLNNFDFFCDALLLRCCQRAWCAHPPDYVVCMAASHILD
jgi:hypothetical protein